MHLARYQDTVATAQALLEHGIEWTPALARDFERAHQWSLEHQGRAIPPGSRTRTREMKAWARAVRSLIKRRQYPLYLCLRNKYKFFRTEHPLTWFTC